MGIGFLIEIDDDGKIFIVKDNGNEASQNNRNEKGKNLAVFPDNFCVLDLETTGLSPVYDDIIEIAVLKIRNNTVVDCFSTLCNPGYPIDNIITELTGITNEMLLSAPSLNEVLGETLSFIGEDIIVGHNVNFDINFIYDNSEKILGKAFKNDYVDTMRLFRKIKPELEHHRLKDLIETYNLEGGSQHRALSDCEYTLKGFLAIKNDVSNSYISFDDFYSLFKRSYSNKRKLDLSKLEAAGVPNPDSPLYGKVCVFTGTLSQFSRSEAAQLVTNIGGICANGVTKKTNYLILGNNDYCSTIKDGKSNKQKKAEEYKLAGYDIEILPENEFYSMLMEE